MSASTGPAFSANVGLHWADAKHDFCLQPGDAGEREFGRFSRQPDQIDAWAHSLKERFGGTIAVALELTKGPIVYAFQKYDFIVLFPANPSMRAKHRETFHPSHAKDDPTAAGCALDLMWTHRSFHPSRGHGLSRRMANSHEQVSGRKWRHTRPCGTITNDRE